MPQRARDPYQVLGVTPGATDAEVRAAYRRLVQLHHPDHNGGSAESARRFEDVQEAYAKVRALRAAGSSSGDQAPRGTQAPRGSQAPRGTQAPPRTEAPPPRAGADPDLDARLARMESELRGAHEARERARRAAQKAAAEAERRRRPSDEELGYVETDDSFSKIFDDAGAELAKLLRDLREQHSNRDR